MDALLQAIKECKALEYGTFFLKDGRHTHYYLDLRRLTLSHHLTLVVTAILDHLDHYNVVYDAIGGPALGAVPIVSGVLATLKRPLRGFTVRTKKDHGKSDRLVGSVQPGDRCVIVEDVTNSGGSILDTIKIVEEFGCKVVWVITVVDRTGEVRLELAQRNIPFNGLIHPSLLGIQE